MEKIIVSSLVLFQLLNKYFDQLGEYEYEAETKVCCWNNKLMIENENHFCLVECKYKLKWEITIRIRQLKKLSNLLYQIYEQPITILFTDGGGFINVSGIVI